MPDRVTEFELVFGFAGAVAARSSIAHPLPLTSAQYRRTFATAAPKSERNLRPDPPAGASLSRNRMLASWQGIVAAQARGAFRLQFAALALALASSQAYADTFQEKWMGRIARPPADDQEASVYWEDKWDARGKRFKANEVSCAHRTEAFGTIFVVTNLENGKKIRCPVQDRGPYARGRVLDFSLGAARQIGCDGLCRVTVRRAGYE